MRPPAIRPGGCGTSFRIESAETLFPLPDSPTTASVSPGLTSNDTPSTARTTPASVVKYVFRFSSRRRGAVMLRAAAGYPARIERVAQSVAEKVERHHRREDRCAGNEQQPGEAGERANAAGLVQHVAPRGTRLLHTDPEKRQHHLAEDVTGDRQRRRDNHIGHRVGQDVAGD